MKTVRQLLASKGSGVFSVSPEAPIIDALRVMADKGIGAVLVVEDSRVVGIMSERDYARKVVLKGKSSQDTPVREIMTERVVYARPEQTVPECMALMTNKRIRHLPVLEDDRLVGVLSIGDLVKETISEQEFIIRQLENYIHG
ncbi:MAG: CBS domain-containing protein [Betaproteobacteria bacterium]|nr:MAG: CBS domain-containing protein [Betaproteobacteria bacterium]